MSGTNDAEFDRTLRPAWVASQPAAGHLDEDAWRAFLEGRLDADTREAALDHISGCVRCAGVFTSARTAALAAVGSAAPV